VSREADAIVKHLASHFPARDLIVAAIKSDMTISELVRAAAIDQAHDFLFYWPPMLAGHHAAERHEWPKAVAAFERLIDLAPDDAEHWYWLAMASLAGDRLETYQRACDELLRRFTPEVSMSDLVLVLNACLAVPRGDQDIVHLGSPVEDFSRYVPGWRSLPWLYQLRMGATPREFRDLQHPPKYFDARDEFVQAIAWNKAGKVDLARKAYEAALRDMRLGVPRWDVKVLEQILQHEVEGLLGIESPSETNHLRDPLAAFGSNPALPPAEFARESLPSAAER
jgi:hypothetical protein